MEKEKLSEQLKSAVGTTSMSEKSWSDYLDNVVIPFLPEDETKIGDYISKHSAYLKSQSGQYNKDIADKVNEFKKNFKPETSPTVEQPNHIPTQTPSQSDDTATVLKALAEKLEKIEQDKVNAEKQAQLEKRVSEAKAELKSKGADNEAVLEIALGLTKLSGDESKEDIASKVKAEYDKQYTKLYGDGYVSGGSRMNVSHSGNFAAYKAQKQKEGKLPK